MARYLDCTLSGILQNARYTHWNINDLADLGVREHLRHAMDDVPGWIKHSSFWHGSIWLDDKYKYVWTSRIWLKNSEMDCYVALDRLADLLVTIKLVNPLSQGEHNGR